VLLVGFSSRGSLRQSAGCFIPGEDNLVVLGVPGGVFVIDALESGPVCRYGLPLENLEAMDQFKLILYDVVVEIYHDVK
jgi:hypothetical protein